MQQQSSDPDGGDYESTSNSRKRSRAPRKDTSMQRGSKRARESEDDSFPKQEVKKRIFFFKFSGPLPGNDLLSKLQAVKYECFKDMSNDTYTNMALFTSKPQRISTVQNAITEYNKRFSSAKQIILRQQSQFDDIIITLTERSRHAFKEHGFYVRIQNAKEQGDPTYSSWTSAVNESDKTQQRSKARMAEYIEEQIEEDEEFDVVKKRRMIESTEDESPNPDDSPSELERFEEFEQAVLPALLQIHGDDQNNKAMELVQLEKELQAGAVNTSGGVYIASCAAFSTYLKIGATRRSEPTQRLYEISRYVPVPFKLIAWIPSNFPFQLEAELHRHFDTQRLKANGAGTEFFKLDISVLMEVLSEFV